MSTSSSVKDYKFYWTELTVPEESLLIITTDNSAFSPLQGLPEIFPNTVGVPQQSWIFSVWHLQQANIFTRNLSLNHDLSSSEHFSQPVFHVWHFMVLHVKVLVVEWGGRVGLQGPVCGKLLETSPMCPRASATGSQMELLAKAEPIRDTGSSCGIMFNRKDTIETSVSREKNSEDMWEQQPFGHGGQWRGRMRWSRPEDRHSPAVCDAAYCEALPPLTHGGPWGRKYSSAGYERLHGRASEGPKEPVTPWGACRFAGQDLESSGQPMLDQWSYFKDLGSHFIILLWLGC